MPFVKCVTVEQEKALEELKSSVKNELTSPVLLEDDVLFYKFLKDRDFNVKKAEKMLRKHLIWRKVHEVDSILETFIPKEVFVKYAEPNFIGFDKDGDIVTFESCINNPELAKCIKLNDYIKHWIWFAEKHASLNRLRAKKKGLKAPVTLIIDLEKLDFSNATSRVTVDMFLRLTRLIRDNYAERMKAAYIINAPSYYVFVFKIIQTMMSNVMIERIHFYGDNGWKEKLLEAIDADVLPVFLGGKRTDPDGDPYCRSFIRLYAKKIPETYYLSDEERFFKNPAEISRLMIPPSDKKEISVIVNEAGSLIRCRFMAVNRTIAFGLFFQESKKELKVIIPMYEYDTSDGTEDISYRCTTNGNYIIIFDNSYSRFNSKEVQYIIRVEKPEV